MKIVFFADAHLIADSDPYKPAHVSRACFKTAWPSFVRLLDRVNDESPDLVVCLGDLVDWFSLQNVAMGLDLMSRLRSPWWMTPGNHDIDGPPGIGGAGREDARRDARAHWAGCGCDWNPRVLEGDGFRLVAFDSAQSALLNGTEQWIEQALRPGGISLLATHVPVDISLIRDWIIGIDPRRDLRKYVQSGAPHLYRRVLRGRADHVFTGHLHLAGRLQHQSTTFHMLNMSISTHDTWRDLMYVAEATVVSAASRSVRTRVIRAE